MPALPVRRLTMPACQQCPSVATPRTGGPFPEPDRSSTGRDLNDHLTQSGCERIPSGRLLPTDESFATVDYVGGRFHIHHRRVAYACGATETIDHCNSLPGREFASGAFERDSCVVQLLVRRSDASAVSLPDEGK